MMFFMMQAFGISLIAIAFGVFLYIWADKDESSLGKFFGFIVIIFSILNILCTTYYGWKYGQEGYFTNPLPMQRMMQNPSMMSGGNMMNQNKSMMNNQNTAQQHSTHH